MLDWHSVRPDIYVRWLAGDTKWQFDVSEELALFCLSFYVHSLFSVSLAVPLCVREQRKVIIDCCPGAVIALRTE